MQRLIDTHNDETFGALCVRVLHHIFVFVRALSQVQPQKPKNQESMYASADKQGQPQTCKNSSENNTQQKERAILTADAAENGNVGQRGIAHGKQ
jgi:hypothetical protein